MASHRDRAHSFDQVMKDTRGLYFARDALTAIITQDTQLRGRIRLLNLDDRAHYSVFGMDLVCTPIGVRYCADTTVLTRPNQYQGNSFLPGQLEAMVLLMAENTFSYPHPSMALTEFLRDAR